MILPPLVFSGYCVFYSKTQNCLIGSYLLAKWINYLRIIFLCNCLGNALMDSITYCGRFVVHQRSKYLCVRKSQENLSLS